MDANLKKSDSEVRKSDLKKPQQIPEPRRSLSATPVTEARLPESPTKSALVTRTEDGKREGRSPEVKVEFKLPEPAKESLIGTSAPTSAGIDFKTDADKLAEFAGLPALAIQTKRFKPSFR